MIRYRMFAIAAVIMIFPSLQAGACQPPSVVKSILKPTKNDLSTMNDGDLGKREKYLTLQRSSEKREWQQDHEDAISCGTAFFGSVPIIVGMCSDGLPTITHPSLENVPVGAVLGLITSITTTVAFAHWYQPPETETSKQLALVLQESKRRKEKVD